MHIKHMVLGTGSMVLYISLQHVFCYFIIEMLYSLFELPSNIHPSILIYLVIPKISESPTTERLAPPLGLSYKPAVAMLKVSIFIYSSKVIYFPYQYRLIKHFTMTIYLL